MRAAAKGETGISNQSTLGRLIWAQVGKNLPLLTWIKEVREQNQLPLDSQLEKLNGSEASWAQIVDAQRSLGLFSKQKLIVVFDAEKILKKEKPEANQLDALNSGAYPVIFQSDAKPAKNWKYGFWEAIEPKSNLTDDKSIFRWIEAIEAEDLRKALLELEIAYKSGQHPLIFIQLATRHFRLGRLIHHATEKRLKEDEISRCLKVPVFVVQKWKRKKAFQARQWNLIFDRLLMADLELKSGAQDAWPLRTLTFDLIRSKKSMKAYKAPDTKPASLFEKSLWKVVPSFS